MLLIAGLTPIYSLLDDPLASTFRGRPVKGSPDQTVLDHVASWVTQCNDAHDGCTSRDSSLPTRIIDVGIFDAESLIKLVEVDEGTKGNYIALSYCWGVGTNHFTTSQESLLARKTGIHLGDLPQTFQDAIVMTRLLGVTYLWIDSICICQDDLADWERESARMASVYSNAYLTIAATGQSSSLGGLFFERPLKTFLRLPFMTPGGKGGHVLLSSLDKAKEVIKSYRTEMRSEPLAERAWAFQERVLARRVIHFASDQVSFECLEGSIYEDGLKLPDRYHSVYLKNPAEFITDGDQVSHRSRTGAVQKPKDYWNALLWIYGSRKLTYPADKLPALAGITKVYSQLMDDEYIAGIWRKSMVEGLCWQSLKCTAASGPYRAPSWSWASVDGIPATGFRADPECLATILDYRVDVDGDNPFGRVKSGWIKIEAPFVPLTLAENTGPMGHMLLKPEEGGEEVFAGFDTIDRLYSVSAGMVREMKLFALIMARVTVPKQKPNSEQSSQGVYQSLIVTPAETVESSAIPFREMKRVGMLLQSAETLKADELEDSRTTVTLV